MPTDNLSRNQGSLQGSYAYPNARPSLTKLDSLNFGSSICLLLCSGQQHVEWSTPQDPSDGRLVLTDCSGSGLFCSSLTIHKAVANDTSLYRCYYRDLPVEDGKTSTSVYVFVQGSYFDTCTHDCFAWLGGEATVVLVLSWWWFTVFL